MNTNKPYQIAVICPTMNHFQDWVVELLDKAAEDKTFPRNVSRERKYYFCWGEFQFDFVNQTDRVMGRKYDGMIIHPYCNQMDVDEFDNILKYMEYTFL